MITKPLFISTIEAMQEQYLFDKKNADLLGVMFGAEISGAYNTSYLSNAMLSLLRVYFPKDEEGHCEIEHWCYCLNFGKLGEEYESPGQLYDRLNEEKSKRLYDEIEALGTKISGNRLVEFPEKWKEEHLKDKYTASPCIDQLIEADKKEE